MRTGRMRTDCWIKPPSARSGFKDFFSKVDADVSEYYQLNPNMREEHIESRLATTLEKTSFEIYRQRVNIERRRKRLPSLALSISHITHKEVSHGADIGLVASLSVPGEITLTKASLIQGKRLYARRGVFDQDCEYEELFKTPGRSNIAPQWARMLKVTPASAYLFYNPLDLWIGKSLKSVGTRVLSAQIVKGKAAAGKHHLSARDLYDEGSTFSDWVIDEFICCNSGDSREEVISVASGENPNFGVRQTLQVSIESENIRPELFMTR